MHLNLKIVQVINRHVFESWRNNVAKHRCQLPSIPFSLFFSIHIISQYFIGLAVFMKPKVWGTHFLVFKARGLVTRCPSPLAQRWRNHSTDRFIGYVINHIMPVCIFIVGFCEVIGLMSSKNFNKIRIITVNVLFILVCTGHGDTTLSRDTIRFSEDLFFITNHFEYLCGFCIVAWIPAFSLMFNQQHHGWSKYGSHTSNTTQIGGGAPLLWRFSGSPTATGTLWPCPPCSPGSDYLRKLC